MTVEVCRDPPKNNKGHLECWDKHRCTDICRAPKNTAELQRAYEQRTSWRQIRVGECSLCGQSKASLPANTNQGTSGAFISATTAAQVVLEPARSDEDLWLEELALLAEATLL